ncbi:MAG: 16S rRNA (adenine(1518)-N(6)/adenine(1519)-N(6))-dimethyltransferase RsmA [Candidatus Marsarchaeota archaeon]|nr:16S rRNA (adenine(1518)-N(6)/adenine(1519)-N(6))-dimethyltransferase RsmA [Candidatus Marsarchaeota archaeon]MCL5413379.1 16S rRNA (adenine(1518)-N(6)/adenine(1519)-N(6))-dimethyltransferase RsmA [Candidatus Marsarchaeota archaeon]
MNFFGEIRSKRALGQVFLVNQRIAEAEAAHAYDKVVLEIGPGTGMLTRELCKNAKRVIAVEKDSSLYEILKSEMGFANLVLINGDFFSMSNKKLGFGKVDIVISNIPYNLSSKMIGWLAEKRMQAVLCLQKEFVQHMMAKPDTPNYSRLSVVASLMFRINQVIKVPRGNFRPIPKVDSVVIYIKPLNVHITARQTEMIGLVMQHKKKTVRNAIIDSRSYLKIGRDRATRIADAVSNSGQRVFKLNPSQILEIAKELEAGLK